MPLTQSSLFDQTISSLNSLDHVISRRTAMMIALSSALLLVCLPGGIAPIRGKILIVTEDDNFGLTNVCFGKPERNVGLLKNVKYLDPIYR